MFMRQRLLMGTDRLAAILLVALIAGTILAFGGRVWWGPPALAVLTLTLVMVGVTRCVLQGQIGILKSPITFLAVLALGLAVSQLAPLPSAIASRISPGSHHAYAIGMLPDRAREFDPSVELPEPANVRSPITVDRAATLRWAFGALIGLSIFWTASRFADRLGHLLIIWGSVVSGFFVNTALVIVQLASGSTGLFGFIEPGKASRWAPGLIDQGTPNLIDLLESPGASTLRALSAPAPGHLALALPGPERAFSLGTQVGGPGAYLALGSIALPLALALLLQIIAPRGSRESLASRLTHSGQTSLVVLIYVMLLASALMIGLLAGPLFAIPFGLALLVVGLPGAWSSGLRWSAVGLTFTAVVLLASGAALGEIWARSTSYPPPVEPISPRATSQVWADTFPIIRDFPFLGTGFGTFASIYPYYKSRDAASTTALSSMLQWWAESGVVGLLLLGVGGIWVISRLPGSVRRVGTADRALAFGLIGAASGFTLFSAVHWSVELTSVALAASAVGGTLNRWLAGGTDLFVERG
jgi:hypothetical protein